MPPRPADDPSNRPLAREYSQKVAELVGALSPYDSFVVVRYFGLGTARRTPRQIADEYNAPDFATEWEYATGRRFRAFGGPLAMTPRHVDAVMARLVDRFRDDPDLRDLYEGDARPLPSAEAVYRCQACDAELPPRPQTGRARTYCSDACRKAAQRRRKAAEQAGTCPW